MLDMCLLVCGTLSDETELLKTVCVLDMHEICMECCVCERFFAWIGMLVFCIVPSLRNFVEECEYSDDECVLCCF